jgi:hypothetical protein
MQMLSEDLKRRIRNVPLLGTFAVTCRRLLIRQPRFRNADEYWEARYRRGGTSGPGSYGRLAQFKAEVLNELIQELDIRSAMEFGCGDGHQLGLVRYPSYVGLDVSKEALKRCISHYAGDETKSFFLYSSECFIDHARLFQADATLSLDVIFHLTEDDTYTMYMSHLFHSARRFVIIYASDEDRADRMRHLRHRAFGKWIQANQPAWSLFRKIPNRYPFDESDPETSYSDFYIYQRHMSDPKQQE